MVIDAKRAASYDTIFELTAENTITVTVIGGAKILGESKIHNPIRCASIVVRRRGFFG